MHNCPDCGDACYCDLEDHAGESPDDCVHVCAVDLCEDYDDDDFWIDDGDDEA